MNGSKPITVGFVGLGVMGGQIARRLISAGHVVHGYNRTRSKAAWLEEAGMTPAPFPRAAAAAGDVVFSMVSDSEALRSVTQGPDGIVQGLRAGSVYVDMSTVDPRVSRELAQQVEARGAKMLDAPVSGSVSAVQTGKLSFMVGGDEAALDQVQDILLDIGSRVTLVGPNGQGCVMKVATNLEVAVQMIAFSESLLLAEAGGIDRRVAADVILNSAVASPMLQYRAPFVLDPPEDVWFTAGLMAKDLRLALDLARTLGVAIPTTEVAERLYERAIQLGLADAEMAAVINALQPLGGPSTAP